MKGIVSVYETDMSSNDNPEYMAVQESTEDQLNNCAYQVVFEDSKLLVDPSFETIRTNARKGIVN